MRSFLLALLAVLVPLTATAMAGKEQAFGAGVTGDDRVKIADLVANPEAYVGQTVRVEGVITKLTEKGGAWVELTDAGAVLRVDVNARKMSFPDDVMGKRVAVQGVFAKRVTAAGPSGRAAAAQAAVHGKSDLPTGEHGKSEYAHAAEHGKSALAHEEKEKDRGERHGKPEKGEKGGKADKGEKHEKGEKVAGAGEVDERDDAAKPARAEKVERAPAPAEAVVYELEGTGAILL